jgi:hypothetical protein
VINKPRLDAVPPKDLQRVFETALGEIQQAQSVSQTAADSMPVSRGGVTSVTPQVKSEKRALSDAASALARLWKVSPHPAR